MWQAPGPVLRISQKLGILCKYFYRNKESCANISIETRNPVLIFCGSLESCANLFSDPRNPAQIILRASEGFGDRKSDVSDTRGSAEDFSEAWNPVLIFL
jgi:hypothetical protein